MLDQKVWYVTGASKGLGLAIVKKLLDNNYRVAATSRNVEELKRAVGQVSEDLFLPLQVDLKSSESIDQSMKLAYEFFGQIDVAVNNAGYGIGGAIEELSNQEIMSSFEVNVFGSIYVIQSVLPYMRAKRYGHIINISSIAGLAPHTGWSIYAATKSAIMGMSDVLAQDVKSMGINVTVVAPGGVRTEFNTAESLVIADNKIADYLPLHEGIKQFVANHGKQLGDPEKAAEVFIELVESDNPPTCLFLGSDAYQRATEKFNQLLEDMQVNKKISERTDSN
ncbi:SDR family oxidoreductase [Paenibacillus sp. XY044]|uniref:SDR family oxidoreductase n=1 Tax=Paenibacillus sp. XY044 TaxID=2026089 RepID=UPI000B99A4BC|nr:SDR family oxidoreductase [Paenibacillus sp. XY044]OZB92256.1 short-chain dehydrogenase/reductase [Paenibacillus sp. XY044]